MIVMRTKLLLLGFVIFSNGFLMSAAHSAFYKWVDEHGQMHYTQTPPQTAQMNKKQMSKALSGSKADAKTINILIGNW